MCWIPMLLDVDLGVRGHEGGVIIYHDSNILILKKGVLIFDAKGCKVSQSVNHISL